jgi:peroxiredoxin
MIEDGESAPEFRLPAAIGGAIEEVDLADHLEDNVVVLAFYPGDFNPACDGTSTGLDDLDLLTMQKDVVVLGISGDSVYSHRAFAEEYGLDIPLLADTDGEVAAAYGVAGEEPGVPTRRAVFVVDPERVVQHAWVADSPTDLPDTLALRSAVEGVGGGETARARYRVAHAHYVEGRRAFTSAMAAFEDREWLLAKNDFAGAETEFGEAAEGFDTAARFAEEESHREAYEHAGRKAEELSRAAEWLSRSAGAFASGEGSEGDQLRSDAETPLEAARDIPDPVPPDEFPPDRLADDATAGERTETAGPDLSVGEPRPDAEVRAEAQAAGSFTRGAGSDLDAEADEGSPDSRGTGPEDAGGERIDDTELAEITAELEGQNGEGSVEPEPEPEAADSEERTDASAGDVDLDLAEPAKADDEAGDGR